jgi:hypothetical protein
MIAALFVAKGGCYSGLEGVEPWDEARDARLYPGPHPIVAHPPCQRWGKLWAGQPLYIKRTGRRKIKGDDEGCFAAALAAARKWGGVIEHPWGSHAWAHFGLNRPARDGGWITADFEGGWTCCVEQGRYGHYARKPTLLLAYRVELPELAWGIGESRLPQPSSIAWAWRERSARRGRRARRRHRQQAAHRHAAPFSGFALVDRAQLQSRSKHGIFLKTENLSREITSKQADDRRRNHRPRRHALHHRRRAHPAHGRAGEDRAGGHSGAGCQAERLSEEATSLGRSPLLAGGQGLPGPLERAYYAALTTEGKAMSEAPKVENAPGLVWRERKVGWSAWWQCRSDLAKRGFQAQATVPLFRGIEPSELDQDDLRQLPADAGRHAGVRPRRPAGDKPL